MTTFLSYENPEPFGVNQFMPDFPVSSIVDSIVLLNLVELGNTLHRAVTVVNRSEVLPGQGRAWVSLAGIGARL